MKNKSLSINISTSTFVVVQIVFLILKLVGVINWAWWLVFLPAIIWAGLFILVFIFALIFIILNQKNLGGGDDD